MEICLYLTNTEQTIIWHVFYSPAALLAMQSAVLATAIPLVCPSVTRWYPIQTNEHRITRCSLWSSKNTNFLRPTMVGGDVPFHLKFALKVTHPSEMRRPRPISAYNVSTVRANEKSSIIANRKWTTRFSKSYRWSAYVTPKSPKRWLKK